MYKFLLLFFASVVFSGCSKSSIQIFSTNSINSKLKDEYYVYENDTLNITYAFWADKGIMSFSVYNKLNKPIYIDWKNSSFIYNSNKLNYWVDELQTKGQTEAVSFYRGYYYKGPLIKPGYVINNGVQNSFQTSSSTTTKPERITFIPPRSGYDRSQFYLLPVNYFEMSNQVQKRILPRNDNPKKNTVVYSDKFSYENSPLRFRNYLAFSFSENSQQFHFVDNEFYLSSVEDMDVRHFQGKIISTNSKGQHVYEKPSKKKTSFYIQKNGIDGFQFNKRYSSK